MKDWKSTEHLSELDLELRAAGEAPPQEREAMEAHLRGCPACRAKEAEWRALFAALASLREVQLSPSFDARVMARVRPPEGAEAAASFGRRSLLRRLRPVIVGAAASWAGAVVIGAAWLATRVDLSAGMLLSTLASEARQLLLAGLIEVAGFLHTAGAVDLWNRLAESVPGPAAVMAAVALMTALSGLAGWILYRVTEEPARIGAHA